MITFDKNIYCFLHAKKILAHFGLRTTLARQIAFPPSAGGEAESP